MKIKIPNILHIASPIIVDLRCPTCISLATFGELKSTTIFSFSFSYYKLPVYNIWLISSYINYSFNFINNYPLLFSFKFSKKLGNGLYSYTIFYVNSFADLHSNATTSLFYL